MDRLTSYVCGQWRSGEGPSTPLVNPATEEPLAEACAAGLDLGAALAFARDRGGRALRAMTFRRRAELLRESSRVLHASREELLSLAVANGGNTRSDAKFDVDGALATLVAYADLGDELGDRTALFDGDAVALGRGARLAGQHVFVPRRGVAVHVNAFNFPAWGFAEKAACALLAGMPVVCKPATSTAMVTHRMVDALVAGRLWPEGAISLVCGPCPALVASLGGQDVLAFTGSSATAATLRAARAFAFASAHVNVEADSLNAAVLGPDVDVASELGDLFVADVVRDMTQKAGQKCTAIRRAYVPAARLEAVRDRLIERLASVRVGDPARDDVTMGPVATAAQLDEVRAGIAALSGGARLLCGGAAPFDRPGYFVAPTLLCGTDARPDDAVHTREVFGPVATLVAYDGTAGAAAERVAWGGGGLVASIYSDDRAYVRALLEELLPWHGRVAVQSSKAASQAVPPGTVLPSLVHGGPGRAGGGEELGGRRGLSAYMQRVAVQGDRAMVETALLAMAGR